MKADTKQPEYFETRRNSWPVKNTNDLKTELRELSPLLLERKGSQEGFNVPEHYFRTLPDEVMSRIAPETALRRNGWNVFTTLLQSLWQPRYVWAGAVAVASIVIAVCFFYHKINTANQQPIAGAMLKAIPDDDLQQYISNNLADFDPALILKTHFDGQKEASLPGSIQSHTADELELYLENIIDELELEELEELL